MENLNAIFELIDSPDNSDMVLFLLLLLVASVVSVSYAYKIYKESKGPFDGY
jgi:hypothetical protein